LKCLRKVQSRAAIPSEFERKIMLKSWMSIGFTVFTFYLAFKYGAPAGIIILLLIAIVPALLCDIGSNYNRRR